MHFNLSEERKMLKESCDRLLNDQYTQYKTTMKYQAPKQVLIKNFGKNAQKLEC